MSHATSFDLYHDPLLPGVHAIEASAGTGKTYTLAQLVLRLVVEKGVPIEQILVVTFTRAAAAELRERIFDRLSEALRAVEGGSDSQNDAALKAWLDQQPDMAEARRRLLQARLMLDQAPIHTIDAFAMQVAREHALALGLPWDAVLLEDAERLDQQIIDELWHGLDQVSEALRQAILEVWPTPDALHKRMQQLGMHASFQPEVSLDALSRRRAEILERWPEERLRALYDVLKQPVNGNRARAILTPLKEGRLPDPAKLDVRLIPFLNDRLKKNASLDDFSETQRSELRCLDNDLHDLPTLNDLVSAWFQDIYRAWCAKRQQYLQQQGRFTYESLKHRLAEAVGTHPALRQALQQGYQACLIDEFQDTDPDQWRLFSALFGESGTHWLFLIGDPKQAIYSFRGANLLTYFAAVKTAQFHHTLDTNYRSHPDLVEGFNQLFAEQGNESTFLSEDCVYHPVQSGKQADDLAFTLEGQPFSLIRVVTAEAVSDKAAQTLQQLARDVVRMLSVGRLRDRKVDPGDLAVLVKSNADALAVQQVLRRVKVPSVLTSSTSVWQSDSAEALLQLLRAILDPRQRQYVRAVLAGPYFQYTLVMLNEETSYDAAQLMLSEALQRWETEGVLAALLALFQQAEVWSRLARLPDGARRVADTRHLLELLHQQAHQQQLSPQALVRWALQTHQRASGEGQTLRLEKDDDAVEIVTMHSAKGLEYPIVFVYGAWKAGMADKTPYPLPIPTPDGKVASFSKTDRNTLMMLERQELRRLFYVACTRAVSHLTLYWPNADGEQEDWPDALNGILRPRRAALEGSPVFRFEPYAQGEPQAWIPPVENISLLAPPPIAFDALRRRSRLLTSYSGLTRYDKAVEAPDESWDGETESVSGGEDGLPAGAAFGTWVHDILEQMDFSRPDWTHLKAAWLSFPQGEEATWPDVQCLIERVLSGNCQPFRLKDLPAHALQKEHHFVLHAPSTQVDRLNALFADRDDWTRIDGHQIRGYLQGYIDLIAEVDGRYYIVDYKTNRLSAYDPPSLAAAMAQHHYLLQALIYTLALDAHLRAFKPDYDPSVHLGGVRYLFMRGMRPDCSDGVYAIDFTPEVLEQARAALLGGVQ